mmetsp:Transcript_42101/g.96677  ORF Transcript_42101/g.96677 Transcript_42101/m.96677 type:complete len:121 (-) Transcript_42101:670-1032(-)
MNAAQANPAPWGPMRTSLLDAMLSCVRTSYSPAPKSTNQRFRQPRHVQAKDDRLAFSSSSFRTQRDISQGRDTYSSVSRDEFPGATRTMDSRTSDVVTETIAVLTALLEMLVLSRPNKVR